jgi:hypothetical protein
MKKILFYLKIHYKIILLILVVVGTFYWFQLRPTYIRKECNATTFFYNSSNNKEPINSPAWLDMQEKLYKDCLRYKGLEE